MLSCATDPLADGHHYEIEFVNASVTSSGERDLL